ncbi:hypothetical protein KCU92_g1443, partial [Aureobasidium melanogenum]
MASPNIYVHQVKQDMLEAYNELGFTGIALEIPKLNQNYSPDLSISGLSAPVVEDHSSLLLSQLTPEIIRSVLVNTLVQDVTNGTVTLNNWNKIPRLRKEKYEPGVYVNYFTKDDGTGLTIKEYEEYVDIICAVLHKQSLKGETHDDMVKRINEYYNSKITSSKAVDLVAEAHNSVYTRTDKKGKTINPTLDLNAFEKSQRDIVTSARAQDAKEIRFSGEVGWAMNVDDRCKTHAKLQRSTIMFRLTMCIVGAYFPNYTFNMTSYCLFRVVSWIHAEIGESLGSHLVNSYGKYGGFNYSSAGVFVEGALRTNAKFWDNMCIQYEDMVKFSNAQVDANVDRLQKKHKAAEDKLRLIRAYKKLQEQKAELADAINKLINDDELDTVVRRTGRKFEALKATIESKHKEAAKCQAHLNAFATTLGYKPLRDAQATPYIERAPASSALQSTQVIPANTQKR